MSKPKRSNTEKILDILNELYPNPKPALKYENPFQLLLATILSAQSTDNQVNRITEKLFKKYNTPTDIACLSPKELEEDIRSCGLYKNKAQNIIKTCCILKEQYNSEVPDSFEHLTSLPGVGRKTANVVLANAFGKEAIAVDTHVFRVANRLGLADAATPEKTEEELKRVIPSSLWSKAHHWLIFHGRDTCKAKSPRCPTCRVRDYCKYYTKGQENRL